MEWKDISENGKEHPYKIIERELQGFSNASKEMVELSLYKYKSSLLKHSPLKKDFQFSLNLRSKYVKDYTLQLFIFGYNVDLEIVEFVIEETIYNEVCKISSKNKPHIILNNNKDLIDFLEILFTSKRFTSILSGLIKIAESNKNGANI
jgi:hypothetical protein